DIHRLHPFHRPLLSHAPCPYSFFYSGHLDHPYLHSFPTRRSSDLHHVHAARKGAGEAAAHVDAGAPGHGDDEIAEEARQPERPEDRKSTRLNSSHSQISYAVFCLKKKKRAKKSSRTARPVDRPRTP